MSPHESYYEVVATKKDGEQKWLSCRIINRYDIGLLDYNIGLFRHTLFKSCHRYINTAVFLMCSLYFLFGTTKYDHLQPLLTACKDTKDTFCNLLVEIWYRIHWYSSFLWIVIIEKATIWWNSTEVSNDRCHQHTTATTHFRATYCWLKRHKNTPRAVASFIMHKKENCCCRSRVISPITYRWSAYVLVITALVHC